VHGVRPRNIQVCHPGPVGSVGDVLLKSRMPQSTPDMTPKFDPYFTGHRHGANVQDGHEKSYGSRGRGARTRDSRWGGRRSFKNEYGWSVHDIQIPDKRTEPWVSSLGDYSWRNKVATVRDAKRTGSMFLPLPGGYEPEPNDLARGGSAVRVTDILGGDAPPGLDPLVTGGGLNHSYNFPTPVLTGPTNHGSSGKQPIGLGRPKII
jgi:hypothetical protein